MQIFVPNFRDGILKSPFLKICYCELILKPKLAVLVFIIAYKKIRHGGDNVFHVINFNDILMDPATLRHREHLGWEA
jgi:hypothetical protein